jgi:hypothetical protein
MYDCSDTNDPFHFGLFNSLPGFLDKGVGDKVFENVNATTAGLATASNDHALAIGLRDAPVFEVVEGRQNWEGGRDAYYPQLINERIDESNGIYHTPAPKIIFQLKKDAERNAAILGKKDKFRQPNALPHDIDPPKPGLLPLDEPLSVPFSWRREKEKAERKISMRNNHVLQKNLEKKGMMIFDHHAYVQPKFEEVEDSSVYTHMRDKFSGLAQSMVPGGMGNVPSGVDLAVSGMGIGQAPQVQEYAPIVVMGTKDIL